MNPGRSKQIHRHGVPAVCWPTSFRCVWGKIRVLLLILFWSDVCRLGEAANPGPPDGDSQHFVLGSFNPSGLRSKSHFVSSQLPDGDIWAISETHLDGRELSKFRRSLHSSASCFQYCVAGYPVDPRADCNRSWKGVAILAKHPTRALPNTWPSAIMRSSRVVTTTTLLDDTWISGGVVYGEPNGHLYPEWKQNNEILLNAVASDICHLQIGPRFVAGDFNVESDSLPAFAILRSAGFKDVQEVAAERWAISPQFTCKGKTRKDFLFISPELQNLLLQVDVLQDVWPDHAVLTAKFHRLSTTVPRQVWYTPANFPWPQFDIDPQWWDMNHPDPSLQYARLWNHIETTAAQCLPFSVSGAMKGRACTFQTKPAKGGTVAPTRRARIGDFQPEFMGASLRHAQWLRQVRRLQNYVRYARLQDRCDTSHGVCLWGSILRSTGFAPNFPDWWSLCKFRVSHAPDAIPLLPPCSKVAEAIFDSLAAALRDFEKDLISTSKKYAKHRRQQNPTVIFNDLKDQPAQGVEILVRAVSAKVTSVRADDCSICLDQAVQWQSNVPVFCAGNLLPVIYADHDCVWLESLEGIEVGHCVTQQTSTGTTEDLMNTLIAYWKPRWTKHDQVPSSRWTFILQFAKDKLPRGHGSWPCLDAVTLSHVIQRKKTRTSAGLDGVSVDDLRAMPFSVLENLCRIFLQAETDGR